MMSAVSVIKVPSIIVTKTSSNSNRVFHDSKTVFVKFAFSFACPHDDLTSADVKLVLSANDAVVDRNVVFIGLLSFLFFCFAYLLT